MIRSSSGKALAYRCRQCGRLCARPDGCADPRCLRRRSKDYLASQTTAPGLDKRTP